MLSSDGWGSCFFCLGLADRAARLLCGMSLPADGVRRHHVHQKAGVFPSGQSVLIEEEGKSERAIFVLDKQGIIRYIDIHDIDHQPDNDEVRKVLREIDPAAAARQPEPKLDESSLPKSGVVLYCTKWCPACRRARKLFEDLNVPFTEIDVNTTPGAAEQIKEWSGGNRTTPTFNIDGTILIDWKEMELRKILEEKGYI